MNSSSIEPESTPIQQRLIVAGLGLVVAIFYGTAAVHFSYTPDDAYVYQQFGRNVAHGGGYSYNAGEPAYGVTAPLWVAIIAGENHFAFDVVAGTKALDLFTGSLALIMFFLVAYEILRHRLLALLATLVFSMNLAFIRWASSGVEISLAVFLLLTALWYSLRNDYYIGSVFAGLVTLVRPEAGLLILAILFDIAMNSVDSRRAFRTAAISLGIFVAVNVPWCLYAVHAFGSPLPAAMMVKGGIVPSWSDIAYAVGSAARNIGASDAVSVVLLLSGILIVAGKKKTAESPEVSELRLLALPLAWVVLHLFVYVGAGADIVPRSLLLSVPIVTIGGFWGLLKIVERFGGVRRLSQYVFLMLTAVLLVQNQIVYYRAVKPFMVNYAQGSEDALMSIGSWCSDSTPADAIIACADVGTIGYTSHRKICDLGGVVTPEMLPIVRSGNAYDEIMMKKMYFAACVPDYVIDRADAADRLADVELLPLFHRAFYGLTVTNQNVVYYTVYQVQHDVHRRALLNKEGSSPYGYED